MSETNKDGAGFKGGLRLGDLLLSVRGELCTSPKQTSSMLRALAGVVVLFVERPLPPTQKKSHFGVQK